MSTSNFIKLAMLLLCWQIPYSASASGAPGSGWRTTLTTAYSWQGKSELENHGDFSVDRGILQVESSRRIGQRWFAGISLGYGEDRYQFTTPMLTARWDDIRSLDFGISLRYLASDNWSFFGLPILRYNAERGADLSDGRELGLITGASYRFSDKLSIGPGFGIFKGVGGEKDFFPILLINWQLSKTLSFETGKGLAASRGPGLSLKWQPATQWKFGIAARYEKSRFRLDDDLGSIGEDKSVPVLLTASWQYKQKLNLTALAGVETSGALSIENSDGYRLERLSYDTAPIAGLVASFKF